MGDAKDTRVLRGLVEPKEDDRDCNEPCLPENFIHGLRAALDAGLSCSQITASLIVTTGLYESLDHMKGEELVERANLIMRVIDGHRKRGGR